MKCHKKLHRFTGLIIIKGIKGQCERLSESSKRCHLTRVFEDTSLQPTQEFIKRKP